ncbi:MAG: ABC transporter permease subunit [Anaerolineae bacterium]|nr:ABC transporter permease subunit [Anaerolineae bacterium]
MTSVGVIFRRALRDARWGIIGWGIAVGSVTLFVVLLFPTMKAFGGFGELLESPIYKALLGEAADAAAFMTPAGFFGIYVVMFVPLYIAIYMVLLGLGVTALEEDRSTIDLLLSTPTPRWQLVVEKFLAIIVIAGLLLSINFVFGVFGVLITPEMDVPLGSVAAGSLAMLPILVVMAALALLLATTLRSRFLAGALAGVIIIGSYMLTNLAQVAADTLGTVKYLSIFTYHRAVPIMVDGIRWGDFAVLSVISLVMLGLAIIAFQRRDLLA